jgi:F-type H+-transporting ATPase subunit b
MNIDMLMEDPKFWIACSFAIFMALFVRYGWPMIARALDSRAAKIHAALTDAERLRAEAADVLASYKQKEAEALKSAEALLEHAKSEADRMTKDAEQLVRDTIDRRMAQVSDNIARAETEAMNAVRLHIIEHAVVALQKVIAEQLEDGADDSMLQKAMADIGRIVH